MLFASVITAAKQWRGIRMTLKILRQLDAVRSKERLSVVAQAVA